MSAGLLLQGLVDGAAEALLAGGYLLVRETDGLEHLPDTVQLPSGAAARVVRIPSELHLRHALWEARGMPLVAVVPEGVPLPADLLLGGAHQRMHILSGDEVLSALLGARVLGVDDPDLRTLAQQHARQLQETLQARTTPTVVDEKLLVRLLLEVVGDLRDLRLRDARPGDLLRQWVLEPPAWPDVVVHLASQALEANHGDPGRILAWALAQPEPRMAALVVGGAVLSVDGAVPEGAWEGLEALRGDWSGDADGLRAQLVALASDALDRLGPHASHLLARADSLANRLFTNDVIGTSRLLPLAFHTRAHAVLTQLAGGHVPGASALADLRDHALAATERAVMELVEDVVRLGRYLAVEREVSRPVERAHAYLRDHAFADLCVRRIRRVLASTPRYRAQAEAVIDRVEAARDAENRAWADALVADYEGLLYERDQGRCVALQNVVRDVLVAEAAEHGERVFLLVLDGCSVPVFLDLLDQLADEQGHAIGLGLRGMRQTVLTGLAPLPTITSHARGAIFLGRIPSDPLMAETVWKDSGERVTDPARFNQNLELGDRSRRLFLKGDLADGGLALTEALAGDTPVVAAVFNAVDDRIGSHDTGQAWRLEVEDVHGLVPALRAALDSERRVLVTADHGHSLYRGKDLRVGAGSTPRYLALGDGDEVPDGFVEIDCDGLAGEPGRHAFAWRSGVYRGQPQVGFHGGCSLEEMVVPVAWLERRGARMDRPSWWLEGAAAPRPRARVRSTPRVELAAEQARAPELPLGARGTASPSPAKPTQAPASPAQASPAAPVGVGASETGSGIEALPKRLRDALDASDEAVLAVLLAEGAVRTTDLATRVGRSASRLAGFLAKLNRRLAPLGARLERTELDDGDTMWRYDGPREDG